mgnify:CR=1 FL=1|jgi:hypothetical protein
MDITFIFQVILLSSFLLVSIAFAIKLVVETYLTWLEVKEGIVVFRNQQQEEEQDDEY